MIKFRGRGSRVLFSVSWRRHGRGFGNSGQLYKKFAGEAEGRRKGVDDCVS